MATHPPTPPDPTPQHGPAAARPSRSRLFPRHRQSVRRARDFVTETLTGWGYLDRLNDARICVSELATNALVHGVPPGQAFAVHVSCDETSVRIEIRDSGEGTPVRRTPTPCEQSGRGLLLVAALADDWGIEGHAVGKTVWIVLKSSPVPGS